MEHANAPTEGLQYLNKALALAESCGDSKPKCLAFNNLAEMNYHRGEYMVGRMQAHEAQRLGKLSANLQDEARALRTEAMCSMAIGNYKDSIHLLHRARECMGLCGMPGANTDLHITISEAEVHFLKSEYAEARSLQEHIAKMTSDLQDKFLHTFALLNIAEIDVMIGAAQTDVQQNLQIANKMFQSTQYATGLNYCNMIMGELHLRDGNTLEAKAQFQQCLSSTWGKDDQVVSYSLERLADICRWDARDFDWSSAWAVVYLAHAHKLQQKLEVHKALLFLGDFFIGYGDQDTAHNLFTVALDGFTHMDVHRSRADCMLRLGDLAQNQGDVVQAEKLWREARPLFEQSLQAGDVQKIDSRLTASGRK